MDIDIHFDFLDLSQINAPCSPCNSGYIFNLPQKLILDKYYDKFNFYFAKPVNEILVNIKQPHVILFHDFQYYDQSIEYIAQLYKHNDARAQLQTIISTTNKFFKPKICFDRQAETIKKRYRKLQKLKNKLGTTPLKYGEGLNKEILKSIDNNLRGNISFDSSVHDIYDQSVKAQNNRFVDQFIISQPIDLKYQPNQNIKLWESDDNDDMNVLLDQINQLNHRKMTKLMMQEDISSFLKKPKFIRPNLPPLQIQDVIIEDQQKRRRRPVPILNMNQIQPPNIMQIMQQYSRNSKKVDTQTDRVQNLPQDEMKYFRDGIPTQSISPMNKLKDKYQAQQMYSVINSERAAKNTQYKNKLITPRVGEKTIDKTQKKKTEQESEKLLKMLRQQNLSQPVSPRRLEIKLSLNKLILEQQTTMKSQFQDSQIENSYGYWTSRNPKQDIGPFRSIPSFKFTKKFSQLPVSPKSKI